MKSYFKLYIIVCSWHSNDVCMNVIMFKMFLYAQTHKKKRKKWKIRRLCLHVPKYLHMSIIGVKTLP